MYSLILTLVYAGLTFAQTTSNPPYDKAPWPQGDSIMVPEISPHASISGKVDVLLLVGDDGSTAQWKITVIPPQIGFEEAVEEVIRQWRFHPAELNGEPVPAWINLQFRFSVTKDPTKICTNGRRFIPVGKQDTPLSVYSIPIITPS